MSSRPFCTNAGRPSIASSSCCKPGRTLYADLFDDPRHTPNHARYTFLDPRAGDFYPHWTRAAADTVALLRAEAGRSPEDRKLNELIGELSTRSEQFSGLWATHNVRWHTTGTKQFHHRIAGDLSLAYEGMEMAGDPGQILVTFTAEPGSTSHQALQFLASWAASHAATSSLPSVSEHPSP